jgi:hypothetical protein
MLKGSIEQSGVSPNFKMLIPLYLDFEGRPMLVGRTALVGNVTGKAFNIALPKHPKRVLLNSEHDILASEIIVNGQ